MGQEPHEKNAGKGRQRGVAPSIKIGGKKGGQRIKPKDHALGRNQIIHETGKDQQRQDQPQFLIYLGQIAYH